MKKGRKNAIPFSPRVVANFWLFRFLLPSEPEFRLFPLGWKRDSSEGGGQNSRGFHRSEKKRLKRPLGKVKKYSSKIRLSLFG